MINPVLERRFADCNELADAWKNFMEFYNAAIKTEGFVPTPEQEQRFLDAKARIAMLHDSFMDSLRHDQNIGQAMLAIVNRSITLRHVRKFSSADQKKIEIEWHQVYLLLNESISQLAEERERLANVNETAYRIGKVKERIVVVIKAFLTSIYFKMGIAGAFLVLLGYVALTVEFQQLKTIPKVGEPYQAFLEWRRDTLGFPSNYGSLTALMNGKLDKMPEGYGKEVSTSANKDSATMFLAGMFTVGGTDAAEYLRSATEYNQVTFSQPEGRPDVIAHLFLWHEPARANRFEFAFRDAVTRRSLDDPNIRHLSDAFSVFYEENILVLMHGPARASDRDPVRRQVFRR